MIGHSLGRMESSIKGFNPRFIRMVATVQAGSESREDTDCGRYFVPINISVNNKHEMLTWNYHKAVGHVLQPRGRKQHMVCAFRITRKPLNYVINVMLIMAMTATLACLSFVVPISGISDRSGVTLTLLLTVVAFKMVLSDTLPKVAYLTFLDYYVFACFLVIFIIAIENFLAAFAIGYVHAVHAVHVHATLRIDCTCVFRSL